MGGVEIGRLARVGDQSGKDAGGEPEGSRSESGLSRIHVPSLRRPARAWVAVFACGSVGQSPEEGAEKAARDDRSPAMLEADSGTDQGTKPASEGMEELLRLWVPQRGIRRDQHVCSRPSHAASETAQPTALPSTGRGQLLRTDPTL